jgi:hypothetical protein
MKTIFFLLMCVCFATVAFADTYTIKRGGSGANVPSVLGYILVGTGGSSYVLASTNCALDIGVNPPTFTCGSGAAYDTIQEEGVALSQQNILNFVGSLVTCANDAIHSRTNCTFLGDGVGYDQIQDEGSNLTKRSTINFTGSSVVATDNSGSTRTDVTITAYNTVQDEGSNLTQQPTLNFIGSTVSCANRSGKTDCTFTAGASCTTDDTVPIGNGSTADCESIPQCNELIGEVLKWSTSSNAWSCVNLLSDNGGGTPFDAGRHFMFAAPSGSGVLIYEGIGSGENGLGTVVAAPTTINSNVALRRCATTAASECGFPGSGSVTAHGFFKLRFDMKWKLYYTSAGGGVDDTRFRMYIAIDGVGGSTLNGTACTSAGSGTDNYTGYWFCFDKANDSSWQTCSGDGADWSCHDSGIAAPSSGDLWTMRIDARDMANVKYYINDVLADTKTNNLPSTSSVVAVGRTEIIEITNTTTQVQIGVAYLEATWD